MKLCHNKTLDGFVALHSLSIIWYVLRKIPFTTRVNSMELICDTLKVSYAENAMIRHALKNTGFTDFEDNLQDCCAQQANADFIVTEDTKDYSGHSVVPAITPTELLQRLLEKMGSESLFTQPNDTVNESPVKYDLVSHTQYLPHHMHFHLTFPACMNTILFVA